MFMQEKLNIEKSVEFLNEGFAGVPKACYDNVFANLTRLYHLEEQGCQVEVLFCFINFYESMYTRHACFIVDGEIIDTTIASARTESSELGLPNYIELKRYNTSHYWLALEKERVTSLDRTLFNDTQKGVQELMSKGLFVIC